MIDVVIKEKRKDFVMMRVLWREWTCYQGEEKKTVKNGRRVACVLQTRVFVMMISHFTEVSLITYHINSKKFIIK